MRSLFLVPLLVLASCGAFGGTSKLDAAQTGALLDSVKVIAADNADLAKQAKLDPASSAVYAAHAASAVKLATDVNAAAQK